MFDAERFAGHLARAIELFRDPGAKKAQKQEFRALVQMVKAAPVTVRLDQERLLVNGNAVVSPTVGALVSRLDRHGVDEIILPQDTPVSHIFELLKAIAEEPAFPDDLQARLRASGAYRLSVSVRHSGPAREAVTGDALGTGGLLRGEPMAEYRSVPVAGAGGVVHEPTAEADAADALPGAGRAEVGASAYDPLAVDDTREAPAAATPPPVAPPAPVEPTGEETPATDLIEPAPPRPAVPRSGPEPLLVVERDPDLPLPELAAPAPPPRAPATPAAQKPVPAASPEPSQEQAIAPNMIEPAERAGAPGIADVPQITADAATGAFAPSIARSKEASELLSLIASEPEGTLSGQALAALGRQVEVETRNGRWELVAAIMLGILGVEQSLADEGARRPYGIALRRMMTRSTLRELALLAASPVHEAVAVPVLRRAGADGVEALMELLVSSQTAAERHGAFHALVQMREGTELLIRLLNDPRWFVVRNAAEAIGELGAAGGLGQVDDAVRVLGGALDHEDERVRKAVALALAKIGTSPTVEFLRKALRDRLPGVRQQVAAGVGRRATALAMSLVVALEEEQDAEVERELILALGRIGSPDAVQALIKLVQPGGRVFSRKPVAKRLAAVDALRLAGTPVAVGTLQGLANDSDKQVRSAAQAALHGIRPRE